MSPIHETGHTLNVAAFHKILNFCQQYGTLYNPSSAHLSLASLGTQLDAANAALNDTSQKQVTMCTSYLYTDTKVKVL